MGVAAIIVAVQQRMSVILWSISLAILLKESAATCSLSDSDKFEAECTDIEIVHPSVVFLNQNFTLEVALVEVTVVNISLFNSSADYCGPSSFSEGLQCALSETSYDSLSQNIVVSCSAGLQSNGGVFIATGEVSLILGLAGSSDCAIPLIVSLNQSKLS